MENNNRNTILAVVLSILVLIGWNIFYISPKIEEERRAAEIAQQREAAQSGSTTSQQDSDDATVPQSEDWHGLPEFRAHAASISARQCSDATGNPARGKERTYASGGGYS